MIYITQAEKTQNSLMQKISSFLFLMKPNFDEPFSTFDSFWDLFRLYPHQNNLKTIFATQTQIIQLFDLFFKEKETYIKDGRRGRNTAKKIFERNFNCWKSGNPLEKMIDVKKTDREFYGTLFDGSFPFLHHPNTLCNPNYRARVIT